MDTIYCKVNAFKLEIDTRLKSTDNIVFQGQADVKEMRVKDNKDETKTYTYISVPTLTQVKKSETELEKPKDITVTYKTKKTSLSQAVRQKAYVIATDIGDDPDKLYEEAMDYASSYLDIKKDVETI